MSTRHKPATLSLLAKELNLHVSTVSRVLSGKADEMHAAASPETIARIQALAEQYNYRPNPHAVSLRTNRSRSIGVLVPRMSDVGIATIYEGIDEAAADHGYLSFVSNTDDNPDRQKALAKMALDRGVEGLIFADARYDDMQVIDDLAGKDIPLVLVSRRGGAHCAVTCDDVLGGSLAAEHLLSLGHTHFAILAGSPHSSTGRDRSEGFIRACGQQGITVHEDSIIYGKFDTKAGREAGEYLLQRPDRPTAIFTINDFLAVGVMGAARKHGLELGRDIAIVGFNDMPFAAQLPIGLSSVHSPRHDIGYRSLELLLARINGGTPPSEMFEPTLIVRTSSDPNATNGY